MSSLVFFGSGPFGIPSLDAVKSSDHTLLKIITGSSKPGGRNLKPKSTPIRDWAGENKINFEECADIHSDTLFECLKKTDADFFVIIDFGFILPKKILELPRKLAMNVHASLLPRYRGAAPIAWALMNAEKETGVSVIRMNEKCDAGDILTQKKIPILPEDDAASLEKKLSGLGAEALLETLSYEEGVFQKRTPQDVSLASPAPKLIKENGRIRWNKTAEAIFNQVRALKIWPGSYTFHNGRRIVMDEVALKSCPIAFQNRKAGEIVLASQKEGLWVMTSDKPIFIASLQLEGKNKLASADFLRGYRLNPGERLE